MVPPLELRGRFLVLLRGNVALYAHTVQRGRFCQRRRSACYYLVSGSYYQRRRTVKGRVATVAEFGRDHLLRFLRPYCRAQRG